MAKRIKEIDPNDIEVYPTVAGFEIALVKADRSGGEQKQYYEIVLRSFDRSVSHSLLLTDNKRNAASRLMDYHAGACGIQNLLGIKIDRRAA